LDKPPEVRSLLPDDWRREAEAHLEPGEPLLAWFEPDLDERLAYGRGLVLLTERRVLAREVRQRDENGSARPAAWQAWDLTPEVTLCAHERAGVGGVELLGPSGRLGHWRYTAGQSSAAHRLVQRFENLRDRQAGAGRAEVESVCPSCGAVLPPDETRCPACAPRGDRPAFSALYRLLKFSRPRAGMISLGFLLTLAGTSAGLIPPLLTIPLIDDVLTPRRNFHLVPWYLAGLAGAAVLAWVFDWGRLYVLAWVSERVSADLRTRTFAHLQGLSLEFFGGKRTGDLIARVSNDSERLCNFLSINLVDFAADILMIILTASILLVLNPLLALVTLFPFPLVVWLVYWIRGRLLRGFRQSGVAWSEMTSVLADTIPGIRVVKAFAQEQRETERFSASNARVLHANDRVNVLWSFFGPTVTFLTGTGLLIIWGFAAWQISEGLLTYGVLAGFLYYITRFYTRMESMIRMVSATQRAAASAQRIFEILDRVPSVPEPVRPVHPGRLAGKIELRGVRFKYGPREVLHGIDLTVRPGEMIGLVGPSGAGKSTLINLICRFYDVVAGAILVDGTDVRSFPVEEYRRNIGIVLQDPFLFYGTVAENIAYGKPGATREEIVAAARAARAHEFILRLPDGYDSLVGERGQSLSGGERQRISIARAILIDPRILVLDEATSSVDTETEREIQAALENLVQGRTTIAIAHRLSTLRRADRLVVLERGNVVEIGSHEELLREPGSYARLHQAQLEMAQGVAV
jgi:ATP-binding cassette subfamily B protein